MRGNCITWAVAKWRRDGGYLLVRKSHWGWFPHFLWAAKAPEDCLSFKPTNPKRQKCPPPWFRGEVMRGDG